MAVEPLAGKRAVKIFERRTKKEWVAFMVWLVEKFVYTPEHGSWLNVAECELSVLLSQCLDRRISNLTAMKKEVKAWENARNNKNAKINWQFEDKNARIARIKLRHLYPNI